MPVLLLFLYSTHGGLLLFIEMNSLSPLLNLRADTIAYRLDEYSHEISMGSEYCNAWCIFLVAAQGRFFNMQCSPEQLHPVRHLYKPSHLRPKSHQQHVQH